MGLTSSKKCFLCNWLFNRVYLVYLYISCRSLWQKKPKWSTWQQNQWIIVMVHWSRSIYHSNNFYYIYIEQKVFIIFSVK